MPLDITEYAGLATEAGNQTLPTALEPALLNQQVSIAGASAQSAPFNAGTKVVRVHADAACRVAFGANPTAAGTSMRMAAGQTEYFSVRPGLRLAVITSA